jgi:YQGE family putative transporter
MRSYKAFFMQLRSATGHKLGIDEISSGNKRFLFTHFNYILFTTLPGIFINTFFFRQDGRLSTVVIYNAIACFGSAMLMQLSSYISIKKSPVFIMRIGIVIYNLFYLTLLLLQKRAVYYMPLFGLMGAMAGSFYWSSYYTLLHHMTDGSESINRSLALVGISGSIVSLIIPVASGFIITNFKGSLGYSIIFLLSFIFSLFTTYLSTRIPYIKLNAQSNLKRAYITVFKTKSWLYIMLCEFVRGIRDMAYPIFLSMVFFKLLENEAILGINSMLCSVVAMISFYFAGKIIKPNNYIKCITIATSVLIITSLIVTIKIGPITIFAVSLINALLWTYIANPSMGAFYSKFDKLEGEINFTQLIAVHEVFFATGRVLGLAFIVFISFKTNLLFLALVVLNLTGFFGGFFLKMSYRAQKKEETFIISPEI